MTSRLSHPKYRPDIDGLRALAVLSVVNFHAFPTVMKGGFIGVDVFFVISGYLISTIILERLESGTFRFRDFYSSRIRRIFPALLVLLAGLYILGWFVLLPDEYKALGKHIAGGSGFISNFVLWSESGYFDNAADTKPLLHLWSLAVEEQFYILFPVLLWLGRKRKSILIGITLLVGGTSFYLNMAQAQVDGVATFYSPQTRFWELMCGSLLVWVVRATRSGDGKTFRSAAAFVGLILLVSGFFALSKRMTYPGAWALIPVIGAALIIFAGPGTWVSDKILSNPLMVWVGLISYPLYLWHWPLLSFARIMDSGPLFLGVRIAIVMLSFMLAWLTYATVEKFMRYGGQNAIKVFSLVSLMVVVGSLGFYTDKKEGLSLRASIQDYEALKLKFFSPQDLGQPKDARIMLLGDSHASHYSPGLKKSFGTLIADYTIAGCIPFYNVDRYDSRTVRGTCAKTMNAALDRFVDSKQMTGIILASMGPLYLTGEPFHGMDPARVTGDGVKLITHPKMSDRWEVYATGMRNTLERLSKANKKILFLLDVPELGFSARSCIEIRPYVVTAKKRVPCAVSRAEYEERTRRYKEMVHSILKDFPNVLVYDPVDDLCDKEWCWAMKGEMNLYKDIDHLSSDGAVMIVEHMRPLIEKLLPEEQLAGITQ